MQHLLAFGLGTQELIWVVVIILVLFGGRKIPELMRGVGKGVGELQKGLEEGKRSFQHSMHAAAEEEPKPTDTPAPSTK